MFASTFKHTHWLVPGYWLGQIFLRGESIAMTAPETAQCDSSLAKIGVILVSCSCGKWSPIDADEPQPLPPSTTRKPNVVPLGHNGLVLHILYFAWNSCMKLVPHQLTVILGLVSIRAIFWRINIPKTSPDM